MENIKVKDISCYQDIIKLACEECPRSKTKRGKREWCGEFVGEERCDRIPEFYERYKHLLR